MRIGNLHGRPVILGHTKALDVERASNGLFGSTAASLWTRIGELAEWAAALDIDGRTDAVDYTPQLLGPPVPAPSQVFAIGLNYADHAAEAEMAVPENPVVFTKFPSSLVGPISEVRISGPTVDWEAELVVVIGRGGRDIAESAAWDHVAGFTVGQDLSDRRVQNWGAPAQFSLGKSFAGYAPTGPAVVTLDEVRARHSPDALRVSCEVVEDGERRTLQAGSTADMIFPIPALVSRLSAIVELRPGDLVFTGTPAGVGMGRKPQEFLKPGQELVTEIEGVGTIRQRLVS